MTRKSRISAALQSLTAGRDHHAWTLEDLQVGLVGHGPIPDFSSVFRAAEKPVSVLGTWPPAIEAAMKM
jgi:hypothetical protein